MGRPFPLGFLILGRLHQPAVDVRGWLLENAFIPLAPTNIERDAVQGTQVWCRPPRLGRAGLRKTR